MFEGFLISFWSLYALSQDAFEIIPFASCGLFDLRCVQWEWIQQRAFSPHLRSSKMWLWLRTCNWSKTFNRGTLCWGTNAVGKAYIDHLHQQRLQYLDTKKKDKLQKRGREAKDARVLFVLVPVGSEPFFFSRSFSLKRILMTASVTRVDFRCVWLQICLVKETLAGPYPPRAAVEQTLSIFFCERDTNVRNACRRNPFQSSWASLSLQPLTLLRPLDRKPFAWRELRTVLSSNIQQMPKDQTMNNQNNQNNQLVGLSSCQSRCHL